MTSSCLCKKVEGVGFPVVIEATENGVDDTLDVATLVNTTRGCRRTSTKQRSMKLVVRSCARDAEGS